MKAKLIRWAVFGVLFAVIPFLGSWLAWIARYHHTGIPFHLYYLWERGELLIVSAGFAADAVGECISPEPEYLIIRLILAGVCILMLFFEAIWPSYSSLRRATIRLGLQVVPSPCFW